MINIQTYSGRKLKYELTDLLGGISLLSVFVLLIGQKTQNKFIEGNETVFVILFVFGLMWIVFRLFAGKIKWYNPVDFTGNLSFGEDYLIHRDNRIQIKEIKTIRIDVTQCKGEPSGGRFNGLSDGTGNFIEIFFYDNSKIKEKLLIEDPHQVDQIRTLMEIWKENGIKIIGYWKPFLHIFQK